MITEERRTEFHDDVARLKLKSDGSKSDKPLRVIGILLMVGGVIGAFVAYQASLSQDDTRDITSGVILAVFCLALSVVGSALYVAAAVAGTLRLWLLRQLVEGEDRTERLVTALRERG
ncbi:hypothetical protein [Nocardioides pacificus]